MNVLSLFDGMSCGQIALERAGIKVDNYFASEIDKHAMKISKKNYPDTVQVGDVTKINGHFAPDIKLLIGGSPCQGFSFAGKQLNFEDPRSKLFFEFVRILKECKPEYFLLENVKMKKESQDVISNYLGVQPVEINSSLVSAQNRRRLYWTNIPGISQPEDKTLMLKDVLEVDPEDPIFMSETTVRRFLGYGIPLIMDGNIKARCLGALEYVKNGKQGNYIVVHNLYGGFKEKKCRVFTDKAPTLRTSAGGGGHVASVFRGTPEIAQSIPLEYLRKLVRKLTPVECERLQTVPDNYTEGVSNTQRYKMLGNGWTVDVIAHIFKNIKEI